MEVEVDGRWYIGADNYSSKKEAEHSAAENACRDLMREQPPIEYEINENDSPKFFPPEYADVEDFIVTMLSAFGGRIRKVRPRDKRGLIRVEIAGHYRYCYRIDRHHAKNQVYFLVDPENKVYYQKCYDPDCRGFRSAKQSIYTYPTNSKCLYHCAKKTDLRFKICNYANVISLRNTSPSRTLLLCVEMKIINLFHSIKLNIYDFC